MLVTYSYINSVMYVPTLQVILTTHGTMQFIYMYSNINALHTPNLYTYHNCRITSAVSLHQAEFKPRMLVWKLELPNHIGLDILKRFTQIFVYLLCLGNFQISRFSLKESAHKYWNLSYKLCK